MIIYIIIIIIYLLSISIIEILSNFKIKLNSVKLIDSDHGENMQENLQNLKKFETYNNYLNDNFIGDFYYYTDCLNKENVMGFYVMNNEYNLLKDGIYYNFKSPVLIKIINIRNEKINIYL